MHCALCDYCDLEQKAGHAQNYRIRMHRINLSVCRGYSYIGVLYAGSAHLNPSRDVSGTTMWQYISLSNSNSELTSYTMHIIKEICILVRVSICFSNLGWNCHKWKLNTIIFPYFSTIRQSKPQFRWSSLDV